MLVTIAAALVLGAAPSPSHVCDKAYTVRAQVIALHGRAAPGRNICRFGVRLSNRRIVSATYDMKRRYLFQLRELTAPLVVAVLPRRPPAGAYTARVSAGLPDCTWRPESGGSYTASNPSGAYGKYQIMPGTHRAHCSDLGWAPADQEQCAARIWQAQGPGAWVNC